MAGIYIHIPFCVTRCTYCDFFSNIRMDQKEAFIQALCKEIADRKEYLGGEVIETLYFGGGTPSQLQEDDFNQIFQALNNHFDLSCCKEITLEANPDDLIPDYITMLRKFPFNRLSMGIQSFSDEDLKFLNRRHGAAQAIRAVRDCQTGGFTNISIDLMYGLPGQTLEGWKENLRTALSLNVQHISSYHLIYEEGTKLYRLLQGGKVTPVTEDLSVAMFRELIDSLKKGGFIHYEISNFGKEGCFSQHNSSYWLGKKYLGLGPSAHSFNLESRSWNVADLRKYISGETTQEVEVLSFNERYNDFVLTALRTYWGLPLDILEQEFGKERLTYCLRQARPHLASGMLLNTENRLKLSPEGIFVSDGIMSDLMYVEDND